MFMMPQSVLRSDTSCFVAHSLKTICHLILRNKNTIPQRYSEDAVRYMIFQSFTINELTVSVDILFKCNEIVFDLYLSLIARYNSIFPNYCLRKIFLFLSLQQQLSPKSHYFPVYKIFPLFPKYNNL